MPSLISEEKGYKPGDVVVVPFPYSDRLAEKRRPALVISNLRLTAQGFVWVVMITSAEQHKMPSDHSISSLAHAGLSMPCVVRPTKIACLEPKRILHRIGTVDGSDMRSILDQIAMFIG